jgi:hypothetical protein
MRHQLPWQLNVLNGRDLLAAAVSSLGWSRTSLAQRKWMRWSDSQLPETSCTLCGFVVTVGAWSLPLFVFIA